MQFIYAGDDLKEKWNKFVSAYGGDGGLLQSWEWGEFQKSLDRRIIRIAAMGTAGDIKAAALMIQHDLHFDYSYLYCPRGPIGYNLRPKELEAFLNEISNVARQEKYFMVKADPAWITGNEDLLIDNGFRKSEHEVQPKCSFIIDLQKNEDELLARMKQKTRYNINLANKKGVVVRASIELADIEQFWQLVRQTSERSSFKPHTKEYYKKQFETFVSHNTIQLYLAEYENKVIAAIMVAYFGKFATYLHGASSDLYRDVMAPYALQWQAIQDAKKSGILFYDFGGVNGETYSNKKWSGITRFKVGFNELQKPTEYVGCFEKVINPVIYSAYKFVKQIRG